MTCLTTLSATGPLGSCLGSFLGDIGLHHFLAVGAVLASDVVSKWAAKRIA